MFDSDRWPNFSEEELSCNHCGSFVYREGFLDRLQTLRDDYGKPMRITSAYRCSQHNAAVSSTGETGPHTTGRAVDIQVYGEDALDLIKLALRHGFTGVGVKQKGPISGRFIHLDDLPQETGRPRRWMWSY